MTMALGIRVIVFGGLIVSIPTLYTRTSQLRTDTSSWCFCWWLLPGRYSLALLSKRYNIFMLYRYNQEQCLAFQYYWAVGLSL